MVLGRPDLPVNQGEGCTTPGRARNFWIKALTRRPLDDVRRVSTLSNDLASSGGGGRLPGAAPHTAAAPMPSDRGPAAPNVALAGSTDVG